MSSSTDSHLSQDLIFRVLDDELTASQRLESEAHLAVCEMCRQKLAGVHEFSLEIEAAVQSTLIPPTETLRQSIQKEIDSRGVQQASLQQPGNVMRRFGWGMGIAATLAFGVLMAPRHDLAPQPAVGNVSQSSTVTQSGTIEVDGETFLPVPNANADLSTSTPHIVQMQVPVSSLADIGIVFEPVTNRVSSGSETERSVLADVLVGADGQPRGVHVLGLE